MYGRIVLDLDGEPFDRLLDTAKRVGRRHRRRPRHRRDPAAPLRALQGRRRAGDRQALPAGPGRPAPRRHRGRVPLVERRPGHRLPRPRAHHATTSAPPSTCRRWCSATATTTAAPASASPATPPPARTSPTATSSSTPRARTSWPASATPRTSTPSTASSRRSTRSCSASSTGSRRTTADMCDTEFTIDQGKLWMLQTRVGKRTGAAALRMAVEMTGQGQGKNAWKISQGGGHPAHHRGAPRPGAAPASSPGRRRPTSWSPRAWPRRRAPPSAGSTSPPTTPPTPPTGARRSSSCAARRRPRTSTA